MNKKEINGQKVVYVKDKRRGFIGVLKGCAEASFISACACGIAMKVIKTAQKAKGVVK